MNLNTMWCLKLFALVVCFSAAHSQLQKYAKVINGSEGSIKKAPYIVALMLQNKLHCGGTLIQNDIVITAAHCVDSSIHYNKLRVRAGSTHAYFGGQQRRVEQVLIHPKYSSGTFYKDLALIRLIKPFDINNVTVSTIKMCDGTTKSYKPGNKCLISGWGRKVKSGIVSTRRDTTLNHGIVTILDHGTCEILLKKQLDGFKKLPKHQMCAWNKSKLTDSCEGDSGGPIVANDSNELIGVTSYGPDCGMKQAPGVYGKVGNAKRWIKRAIKKLYEIKSINLFKK